MVQALCVSGLVDLVAGWGELFWGRFVMRGVGPVGVAVDEMVFGDHSGCKYRIEASSVEDFVPKSTVEAFVPGVLPGRDEVGEHRPGAVEADLVEEGVSNKFGPAVQADADQRAAALRRNPVKHRNDVIGVYRSIDLSCRAFHHEFVDDVKQFDLAAVGDGGVGLEVHRPDDIRRIGENVPTSTSNGGRPVSATSKSSDPTPH